MRGRLLVGSLGLLVGCASSPNGGQLVQQAQVALAAANLCCEKGLQQAHTMALPVLPTKIAIDAYAQAHDFGGNKAFFVLFELPAFASPYAVSLSSISNGSMNDAVLFIPRVAMYDQAFQLTRFFDEKTLRNRGNQLERTVFINPSDREERYLAIYGSDLSASIERAYSVVTVTPVVAGPVVFNMVGGQDAKSVLRSSPTGLVEVAVQGLDRPPTHK